MSPPLLPGAGRIAFSPLQKGEFEGVAMGPNIPGYKQIDSANISIGESIYTIQKCNLRLP